MGARPSAPGLTAQMFLAFMPAMKSARRPRRAPAGSRRALEPADHLHRFVRLVRSGRWEELRLFLDASTVWMIDHHEPGEVFVESSARWFAERTGFELYVLEPVTVRALEGTAMARAAARATWRGADGCLEEASIGLALELASSRRGAWKPVALSLSSGIKVHAGCGPDDFFPRLLNGWVNLDLLHDEPGHGRVDLLSEWPFAEGSAAAVYSEDFIEHLDQREQLIFLGEAFRVLQPGGVLRTVCPALSEDIVRRRFFPAWPRTGFRTIDEGVEWREWGHRLLPTYE